MLKPRKKILFIAFVFFLSFAAIFNGKLYASQKLPLYGKVIVIDPGHGGWDSCSN